MMNLRVLAGVVVVAWGAVTLGENQVDRQGRLERLAVGAGWLDLKTDVRVPTRGWRQTGSLSRARDLRASTDGQARLWTARVGEGGPDLRIQQRVTEQDGRLSFNIKATAQKDESIEGVFFEIRLPTAEFAGGTLIADQQTIQLPSTLPAERGFAGGAWRQMRFAGPKGQAAVLVEAPHGAWISLVDNRRWEDVFLVNVTLHKGDLANGQSIETQVTLRGDGQVDTAPATVTLDPTRVRYRMNGMGGNYCFGIESPVARFTMDNLRVWAARTEMSLRLWEPQNVGGDGPGNDTSEFAKRDVPGQRLRHEFELMAELTRKKIPFTSSIWRMPEWMVERVPGGDGQKRRIPESTYDQVLQSVGSYLVYAKTRYAAEPDYFSFNEPDIGIDILFTPEEHRDAIKRFGRRFEQLGLKTRLILGDVANARGTDKYCLPAAADPEAMKYVGAVAFHSWNGASPQQYAAWGDLAQRIGRPLLVNEAGVDPFAWRGGLYRYFGYMVRDMIHYQELLMHARPQGILYWEFTGDYSLLASDEPKGENGVTERFSLQKHWCNLTPGGSDALPATCDNPAVLPTAFRWGEDAASGYTVHLANPKWPRLVLVQGLPPDLKELNVVRTARGQMFQRIGTVKVESGQVRLELPRESLTTLTTIDAR